MKKKKRKGKIYVKEGKREGTRTNSIDFFLSNSLNRLRVAC